MVGRANGAGYVRSIGWPRKSEEACGRLVHSIFRSELTSAEWMALGTYDRLVELAGCTLQTSQL